ncbi:MAG: diacylglycerol kinase family protein [Micrococcaceae bacterium]
MSVQIIPWIIIIIAIAFTIVAAKLSADSFTRLKQRDTMEKPPRPAQKTRYQVGVVINPSKNNYEEARAFLIEACIDANWPAPKFWETKSDDPGASQTQAAINAGCDLIIACGGDGTVRKCAEQLLHTGIPMGIVPIGTGNLFARNLKLEVTKPRVAVHDALFGDEQVIDAGHVRLDNGKKGVWLVMTGMGDDANVIAKTRPELKKYFSWLAYIEAAMRTLSGSRRDRVEITIDDEKTIEKDVRSILGGNCGVLPGGIDFNPESVIDDGNLEIVILSPKSIAGWFGIGTRILLQRPRNEKVFEVIQAKKLKIHTDKPLEAQVDGDHVGEVKEMELEIDPASLIVKVTAVHTTDLLLYKQHLSDGLLF